MLVLERMPVQLTGPGAAIADASMLAIVCSLVFWLTYGKPLRELANSERQKFERLVEAVPDGVLGVNESGLIQFVNERIVHLFGYSRDELIGRPVEILIPDRFVESHVHLRQSHCAKPRLRTLSQNKELLSRGADGREIPLDISLNHIQTPQGLLVICSVRDITGQKEAHDELVAVNRKLNDGLHDLEESSEELRKLTELGELLQGCVSEDEAYNIIARVMARLVPGTSGGLYLTRSSRNALQLASRWGEASEEAVGVMVPEDCWALRRGRMHSAANKQSTVQCRHINPQHNGYICIPMMAQGETLGILHIYLSQQIGQVENDDEESILSAKRMLLFASSEQIGAALASLRLRDQLKQQSIRDSLTGLFNRRFMEETLEREMLRANQQNSAVSVIAIDLDHFKRFNDAFGHEGGDLVLRELGLLLRKQCNASEIACRLGGEEFLLILPEYSVRQAASKAEAIRHKIESLDLALAGQPLGKITASFGIAAYPVHGSTYSTVCKAADAALYDAKNNGRNCVEVAPLVDNSVATENFPQSAFRSANDSA